MSCRGYFVPRIFHTKVSVEKVAGGMLLYYAMHFCVATLGSVAFFVEGVLDGATLVMSIPRRI